MMMMLDIILLVILCEKNRIFNVNFGIFMLLLRNIYVLT